MKVYLFGSNSVGAIPSVVEKHLEDIIEQSKGNVEFILGDTTSADVAFQLVLSRIGARSKTTLYCIDTVRTNNFDFNTNIITNEEAEFTENNKYKTRKLCDECDFAIAVYDGKTKTTFDIISMLNMRNKPVYTYTLQI